MKQHNTKKRSAPKSGYDFEAKSKYREHVWQTFAERIGKRLISSAKVMLMPSSEGLEIPVAIKHGFLEENIFAIDRSAAILATAKWRAKYPRVRIYAGELGHAMKRIAADGHKVMAANYDLCGPFSKTMIDAVTGAAESGALHPCCVVAITMLKGREDAAAIAALGLLSEKYEDPRIDCLFDIHAKRARRISASLAKAEYKSGPQTMTYCIAETYDYDFAVAEIEERHNNLAQLHDYVLESFRCWRAYSTPLAGNRTKFQAGCEIVDGRLIYHKWVDESQRAAWDMDRHELAKTVMRGVAALKAIKESPFSCHHYVFAPLLKERYSYPQTILNLPFSFFIKNGANLSGLVVPQTELWHLWRHWTVETNAFFNINKGDYFWNKWSVGTVAEAFFLEGKDE